MDRLQTVAHIGQGPADNDAHCVVQIGLFHLTFNTDGDDFFGYFTHVQRFPSQLATGCPRK